MIVAIRPISACSRSSGAAIRNASWIGPHTSIPASVAAIAAIRIVSAPFACIGKLSNCVGLVAAVTRTGQPKTEDNRLREKAAAMVADDQRQKDGYVRR